MLREVYPKFTMELNKFRPNPQPKKVVPITFVEYTGAINKPFNEVWKNSKDSIIVLMHPDSDVPNEYEHNTYELNIMPSRIGYVAKWIKGSTDEVIAYIDKSRLFITVNGHPKFKAFFSLITSAQLKSWMLSNFGELRNRSIFIGRPLDVDDMNTIADALVNKLSTQKTMVETPLLKFLK